MSKYQSIAVIYGSDSSEWEVSCRSGEFTASRIDEFKYDVYEIFARFGEWKLVAMRKANTMRQAFPEGAQPVVDKSDFSVMVLGIPHSTCSAFVTTVAFDKYSCKSYLRDQDFVKMAPDAIVRIGDDIDIFSAKTVARLGLPLFVKPTRGGSSFGITKVEKAEDLPAAIRFAFTEGEVAIVEKAVPAQHELTCAVYRDGKEVKALPIIEIISETGWFDYDAKYNGYSQEVCPAQVSEELTHQVQETSKRIYEYLGCKGLVRMDYLSAQDGLYFLEVNIIPGRTNASLVSKMIRTAGISLPDFLTTIIENA